jgi:SAM-dependent methyltransferase
VGAREDSREFWERPGTVDEFAGRAADHRLVALLDAFPDPQETRVLDIGCAGGRNTVVLAERGFDVFAVDTSRAMVEKTRARLAPLVGAAEAKRRVRVGDMTDLRNFGDAAFHLVVALGVYHNASNREEWDRALRETERVLARGGRVLVSNFGPRSAPGGKSVRPIPREPHVYDGFDSGQLFLLEAEELDAEMRAHGLLPAVPTETVVKSLEGGRRETVNALYVKTRRA